MEDDLGACWLFEKRVRLNWPPCRSFRAILFQAAVPPSPFLLPQGGEGEETLIYGQTTKSCTVCPGPGLSMMLPPSTVPIRFTKMPTLDPAGTVRVAVLTRCGGLIRI